MAQKSLSVHSSACDQAGVHAPAWSKYLEAEAETEFSREGTGDHRAAGVDVADGLHKGVLRGITEKSFTLPSKLLPKLARLVRLKS